MCRFNWNQTIVCASVTSYDDYKFLKRHICYCKYPQSTQILICFKSRCEYRSAWFTGSHRNGLYYMYVGHQWMKHCNQKCSHLMSLFFLIVKKPKVFKGNIQLNLTTERNHCNC